MTLLSVLTTINRIFYKAKALCVGAVFPVPDGRFTQLLIFVQIKIGGGSVEELMWANIGTHQKEGTCPISRFEETDTFFCNPIGRVQRKKLKIIEEDAV